MMFELLYTTEGYHRGVRKERKERAVIRVSSLIEVRGRREVRGAG
jgi:hypothetical protein